MWDFPAAFAERAEGCMNGFHRSFNKASVQNWGTAETPAPVLGLEPGGDCQGVAFRVPDDRADATFEQLAEREGSSYVPQEAPVELDDGRRITATVWVNDRNDRTYLGDKPLDERVRLASETAGERGTAREYVNETRAAIREHDIEDPMVEQFAERVGGTT